MASEPKTTATMSSLNIPLAGSNLKNSHFFFLNHHFHAYRVCPCRLHLSLRNSRCCSVALASRERSHSCAGLLAFPGQRYLWRRRGNMRRQCRNHCPSLVRHHNQTHHRHKSALPAACLCIGIHLEQVASVRHAKTSMAEKRRRQIFEMFMCFGLPLYIMVQGHRFDIIEEYGCRPTTYFSVLALFIVWLPPMLVSAISLGYACLALRHFMLRRITFAAHLSASQSALTTSRYIRLMLMAALQMIWSVAVTSYALWFTTIGMPLRPYKSWDFVHSNFWRIDQYLSLLTPPKVLTSFYVLWWVVPISTWIFVAFFAFGRDAVEEYKKCVIWFRTRILRQTIRPESKRILTSGMWKRFKLSGSPQTATSSTLASPPPYKAAVPPSPSEFTPKRASFDDTSSDISYSPGASYSYPNDHKSPMDTLTDFSPSTNSIPLSPLSPPSPFPPPPASRPRDLRGFAARQTPTSPRPLTYPSTEASYYDHPTYLALA